jgi:hypothetical protein
MRPIGRAHRWARSAVTDTQGAIGIGPEETTVCEPVLELLPFISLNEQPTFSVRSRQESAAEPSTSSAFVTAIRRSRPKRNTA